MVIHFLRTSLQPDQCRYQWQRLVWREWFCPLIRPGRSPVISAWNNDLSSYLYGGHFIEHKTNPERVVIEWLGETFTEEGYAQPNNFEVVLFPNGLVRTDYKSFTTLTASDFGSGISANNGSNYISITANYGNAYTLNGRSFLAQPDCIPLNIVFSGTGSGVVTSNPIGVACNTSCTAEVPFINQITLHPEAAPYSTFAGWGTGDYPRNRKLHPCIKWQHVCYCHLQPFAANC